MKTRIFSLSLVLAGMSMLAIYYLWPPSPSGNWSEDQAKKLQNAQVKYHALAHEWNHSHRPSTTAAENKQQAAELAAAKAELDAQQSGLTAVTSAADSKTRILFWAGIVVTVIGVATFRPIRDDE